MAVLKTKPTEVNVAAYLHAVESKQRREDAFTLLKLMEKITAKKPLMWGPSIVGFGSYHYRYESGHEGDMPVAAFSPRKSSLVVYLLFDKEKELLAKLGKYKISKACLYINKLSDVDINVLEELIRNSIETVKKKYP